LIKKKNSVDENIFPNTKGIKRIIEFPYSDSASAKVDSRGC